MTRLISLEPFVNVLSQAFRAEHDESARGLRDVIEANSGHPEAIATAVQDHTRRHAYQMSGLTRLVADRIIQQHSTEAA